LIVEEERATYEALRDYLEDKGCEVITAGTCALAEQVWRATRPDITILDCSLTGGDVLGLISRLKIVDASIPIVILTSYGSIDLAVEAVKLGAELFLPKPAEFSTLYAMIQRSLENQRSHRQQLAEKTRSGGGILDPFLGKSDSIRKLDDLAHRVALSDTPVLVQGETGTGKRIMAQWLHRSSPRASEPFVDLNCGGLSRDILEAELFGDDRNALAGGEQSKVGLLEIAHKGTVFLNEIENVDLQIQPKLLKLVEEKQFRRLGETVDRRADVHLITGTRQLMAPPALRRQFGGDLYYRISWTPLSLPPLRERVEDIPVLSAHILGDLTADLGTAGLELSGIALRALQTYSWPGNIRELRNVLERAVLVAGKDVSADQDFHFDEQIEQYLRGSGEFGTLNEIERSYIQRVLRKEHGRVQSAARKLGIPRSSLYHKLKQYKKDESSLRSVS
jgi:DNA-binding NtrC family response regulator